MKARPMKITTCLVLLVATLATVGQERFLRPIDEAGLDPSFLAFRNKLIAAVERRDARYLVSILDPKVKMSFGEEEGVGDFKRVFSINNRNAQFWGDFLAALKLGGSFLREGDKRTGLFYSPYTYSTFPEDLDSYDESVIIGKNVPLRRDPRPNAPVVATLSYNIVRVQHETLPKSGRSEYPGWLLLKTLGGLEGFVRQRSVRSAIDWRAGFEKKRGRWVLVNFNSGD
jgi:hypothetical protein